MKKNKKIILKKETIQILNKKAKPKESKSFYCNNFNTKYDAKKGITH